MHVTDTVEPRKTPSPHTDTTVELQKRRRSVGIGAGTAGQLGTNIAGHGASSSCH